MTLRPLTADKVRAFENRTAAVWREINPWGEETSPLHGLDPTHAQKLRDSGLEPETIVRAGAYTERDTARLREMLHGSSVLAPALVLPGFDRWGQCNGYDVARLFPPHNRLGEREVKYLAPTGQISRMYVPPFPGTSAAVRDPRAPVVITEGILKALAAAQSGVPCLGLMGVWNWQLKRADKGELRQLVPDLNELDWQDRSVLIVFDTDSVRKGNVNHAAAELARALAARGADARIAHLPPGPAGPDGRPVKQAIDDFIVRHGPQTFLRWVEAQRSDTPVRVLSDWRTDMAKARIGVYERGVYIDTSPTGTGKSHADIVALRSHLTNQRSSAGGLSAKHPCRSLTLVPTHENCREVVAEYTGHGVCAAAFPQLTSATCLRYDEAMAVIRRGLPFTEVLCPACPHQHGCDYRAEFVTALKIPHAVATHERGARAMDDLVQERNYITLHENPLGIIRPTVVSLRGLLVVGFVASQAEIDAQSPVARQFFRHLGRIAKELDGWHRGSDETTEVPLPEPARAVPDRVYRDLNQAVLTLGNAPPREAMKLALAAALGELSLIAVTVNEQRGAGGEVKLVRTLVGVSRTDLPADAAVWINDATAVRSELEAALEQPVRDMTPSGRLIPQHPVIQVIPERDVTIGREPAQVVDLLRGLLYDLPGCQRVGLLTHQKLAKELPKLLEEPNQGRLAMVGYFGSGLSRGSNQWIENCDVLIVLGTPRVPPHVIRTHLLQLGNVRAAKRTQEEIAWGPDCWSGVTESGGRVTVRTPHYADRDWHAAYCSIVRSELVQSVGRGRGLLSNGIPVYLVTTENLAPVGADDGRNGFPIADHPFAPLSAAQVRVLSTLRRSGRRVVGKTEAIARELGVSPQRARELLNELVTAGRVRKLGARRGWVIRHNATLS